MGGRGTSSGRGPRQITIYDEIKRHEIADIINESDRRREYLVGDGKNGGLLSPELFKKCACCGEYTIPVKSEYEICLVCGWIDDPNQNQNPDSLDGRNPITLNQARQEYHVKES